VVHVPERKEVLPRVLEVPSGILLGVLRVGRLVGDLPVVHGKAHDPTVLHERVDVVVVALQGVSLDDGEPPIVATFVV